MGPGELFRSENDQVFGVNFLATGSVSIILDVLKGGR